MPAELSWLAVSEHTPATATTGRSGATAAAARATPAGALPCSVWRSSALAGDDQPGAGQVTGEGEHVQHELDAGPDRGAEERQRREAEAARRARTPLLPADPAERLLGHVRPAGKADLEAGHVIRGRALLPARRRPRRPLRGPSSGLSTSVAAITSVPDKSFKLATSIRCNRAKAAPPGGSWVPDSSSNRAPSAVTRPAPPSVDATPPRPSTIRFADHPDRRENDSPTPRLEAVSGAGIPSGSLLSPQASADSMMAVPPLTAKAARA